MKVKDLRRGGLYLTWSRKYRGFVQVVGFDWPGRIKCFCLSTGRTIEVRSNQLAALIEQHDDWVQTGLKRGRYHAPPLPIVYAEGGAQ